MQDNGVLYSIQTDIRVSNTCELPREWRLRHVLLWTITKYIRLNRATTERCSGSVRLIHNRGTGKEITPGRHRLFSAVCQVNRAPETRVRFFSFIHKEPGPENLSNSPTPCIDGAPAKDYLITLCVKNGMKFGAYLTSKVKEKHIQWLFARMTN